MNTDEPPTELSLVRHGRTVWHAENRYAGSSDVALDPVGRDQADQLAAWIREHPHDAVACSPLTRARQSAAPAARALGLAPVVVPGLAEADFGSAEGRTLDEVDRDRPGTAAAFRADPVAHPLPGAEDPSAVATRVRQALEDLAAAHSGARILVVGHNTALRLALCSWLGIPIAHYRRVLPRLDNAALTRVRVPRTAGHPPALLGLNLPTRRSP
ncbi:histidine phosphatase family protein [Nocardiopsis salina]|uniref:histidine phosphatase family protein n=1 Tax=Nocardiopsis salina TaxID=245836 RepID=UPI0003471AC2|nr:histidine phosphatase family protein [Nocardiopsis salina]